MKKLKIIFLLLLPLWGVAQKEHKVLFVIADGVPADELERLQLPVVAEISAVGGYTRAHVGGDAGTYCETPTISAPGYNSLLTGTWSNKHNVWDNEMQLPNYRYWNIFRFFKIAYPQKKTAIFSTWSENRTILCGSSVAAAGNLQPDYYFDGLELDTLKFPHDSGGEFYNAIDMEIADTAAAVIRRTAPDLNWVYLEYTDEMGHQHGNGPKLTNAIMQLNDKLQKIWHAIQYREKNYKESWQIWITTDHGREENGYHHGGQGTRERTTWILTNADNLNNCFYQNPAIVDILPSMARFLNIKIDQERNYELDGVSLIGKNSITHLEAEKRENILELRWETTDTTGILNLHIATTNDFKTGGKDQWVIQQKVPLKNKRAELDISNHPSKFYKVVAAGKYNTLNRWITE